MEKDDDNHDDANVKCVKFLKKDFLEWKWKSE